MSPCPIGIYAPACSLSGIGVSPPSEQQRNKTMYWMMYFHTIGPMVWIKHDIMFKWSLPGGSTSCRDNYSVWSLSVECAYCGQSLRSTIDLLIVYSSNTCVFVRYASVSVHNAVSGTSIFSRGRFVVLITVNLLPVLYVLYRKEFQHCSGLKPKTPRRKHCKFLVSVYRPHSEDV